MPQIDKKEYLCIGCGGCRYACPKGSISFLCNNMGQFIPKINNDTCINCKICEKICPVYSDQTIEKEVSHNSIVGNYISCQIGYDLKYRNTSASGGLTTAILSFLLTNGHIDFVVSVRNQPTAHSFYQYIVSSNPEDLVLNSKSAYYPLEMSGVLEYIKTHPGRYALTVLPCQAKMIRTLQKRDKTLNERILFLLGLVCGGMPGKGMVECIAADTLLNINDIKSISFRDKDINRSNNDYGLSMSTDDGNIIKKTMQNGMFGFIFLNKLFNYKGCNVCDDIFAEYADAVFMDAWLPEYHNDSLGTSICIIRNKLLNNILQEYFSNNKDCCPTDIELAIRAQNSVGLIQRKKKQSYYKRNYYRRLGYITPNSKGIRLKNSEKIKFFIRTTQELLIQNKSIKEWTKYKKGTIPFNKYKSKMTRFVKIIKSI